MLKRIAPFVAVRAACAEDGVSASTTFDALDSLEFLELVQEIEREFGIEIPNIEATQFATVGDVLRYLDMAA